MTTQPTLEQLKKLEYQIQYSFYNSKNQYNFLRSKKMLSFRNKWDKMTQGLKKNGFSLDYTIEDVIC
jgi:hypothetical protein